MRTLFVMTSAATTFDIPENPVERREVIKYQLWKRGKNLSSLARDEGVTPQALSACLVSPNAGLERVVASALDVSVEKLFPERFREDGGRIPVQRGSVRAVSTRPKDNASCGLGARQKECGG
ncbi:MAG: helix-turn-helix domain-containing protein [Rhodospirillaceae bacterium]